MRIPACFCLMILSCTAAAANPGSFPIAPSVEYSTTALGTVAHVSVTVYDDATSIDVDVYGLDGMRAGDTNLVHRHRDNMARGESFAFDVPVLPGPGLSSIAVMAKAKFIHAGSGDTVLTFQYGAENTAQQQGHSRCVRKDPEGEWIRLPDCDDAPQAPPELTVAEWKASPPAAGTVRITGYVVDTYLCPPCPMGTECKPCISHTSITIADAPIHIEGAPTIVIAVPAPAPFEHTVQYRFEITAGPDDGLDGRLLRSQRGDEPPWTTPAP